jgi:hypothetical protein
MSNKVEKAVRNPSLAHAKRAGFKLSTDELDDFCGETGNAGIYKRMHFGHGAATGWPDDLFMFRDGHHWWVEFKGEGKEPRPLQEHVHDNIVLMRGDVSVIDNFELFKAEFDKRLGAHAG